MEAEVHFSSRKFIATLIGLALLTGTYIATVFLPVLSGLYPTYVGAVIGILSVYLGGNIASQYVTGKVTKQQANLLIDTNDGIEDDATKDGD